MTAETARPDAAATARTRRRRWLWTAGAFAALAAASAGLAAIWDWNWFRGPVARIASGHLHRDVSIDGNLKVHLFSWQPSATVEGVRIANPAWAGPGDVADIDRIAVQIRLIPLLTGHLDLPLLEFDRPRLALHRNAQGQATWDFSDGSKPDEPMRMPPIHKFVVDDGHIDYRDDGKKLNFAGTVSAKEQLGAASKGFEMTGQGALKAQPFHLAVTGGALLNIDRNKPYPFDADITAGATHVTAQGAVPKPFDMASFWMNVTGKGPDLADLYGLTGVPLPNSPPYSLRARISRDVHTWHIDNVGGTVGSSDLSGKLAVTTGGKRPFLTADLRSNKLSFPDLGALFGGTRATGKVASAKQVAVAKVMQAQQTLFPDATLDFTKIRGLDADVSFKAVSIINAPINLSAGSARVKLNAGLLRVEPLSLDLPQGQITGFLQLDGRQTNAITDLDLRLRNARLETLVPVKFRGVQPVTGSIVARAKLHGTGDSVHDAMGDADGEVMVVVPDGNIQRTLAELAGVDLIKGLGLLFSKDQSTTPIRCGVLHFTGRGGVLSADKLVVDTDPVLIDGGGVINLDKETLAFSVKGHPKKFQLVRLFVPITVSGPILQPKVDIHKNQAIAQGGAAVALGALLSPVAVLLPFVDGGLAKDANCANLLSAGKAEGAPVKDSQVTAAANAPSKHPPKGASKPAR